MTFSRKPLATLISLACVATSIQAKDADIQAVERIIVTAEFHNTGLLDLSNSVSVINDNIIQRRGANHIEQLLNLAPNVNLTAGASRGRFFQIRGIGERSQFIDPVNPSVGLVIDGIDFTGLGLAANTLDIQQVEVFRGPQGTLHGANALAGLINLTSNPASDVFNASIGLELSQFGGQVVQGTVSGPISDSVRYRLAGKHQKSDGFIENTFLNVDDTNNIDESIIKGSLSIDLSKDLTLDWTGFYLDVNNGYDAFSLNNNRQTSSDQPGVDEQESLASGAKLTWTGADAYTLKLSVSGANNDTEYAFDEDWSHIGEFSDDLGPYSSADSYVRDRDSLAIDLNFSSAPGQEILSGSTTWVLGTYYRSENEDLFRARFDDLMPDGTFSNQFDTSNLAVYGQLNTDLGNGLNLVTGIRVEQRDADYSDSLNVVQSVDDTLWGGRVILEHRSDEGILTYGLISRGYKAGGVNGQIISASESNANIPNSTFFFDTEELLNYELGIKGLFFNDRLTAQASIFYQDRNDAQVSQSIFNPDDFSFDEYLDNASADTFGLEAELVYTVSEVVEGYFNLGLLDSEFDGFSSFSHVDAQSSGELTNLDGRDIAQSPSYQFVLGADMALSSNLTLNAEIEGKDSYFFSNGHSVRSDEYVLFNMRLTYEMDNLSVSVWGRNLGDEDVQTRGFFFSNFFGNNPANEYAPEPYFQLGEPRIVGVSVGYSFD